MPHLRVCTPWLALPLSKQQFKMALAARTSVAVPLKASKPRAAVAPLLPKRLAVAQVSISLVKNDSRHRWAMPRIFSVYAKLLEGPHWEIACAQGPTDVFYQQSSKLVKPLRLADKF